MAFDYARIPREYPLHYLPEGILLEWSSVEPYFEELGRRPLGSADDLRKWLQDKDELDSVLYEEKAIRQINISRQTDDEGYIKAYSDFLENLEPKIKLSSFGLLKKYVTSPYRRDLPPEDFGTMDRNRVNAASIFREENVELEKKEAEHSQQYQTLIGAISIAFMGEQRTLQQMSRFYEGTERDLRKEAWVLAESRVQRDSEKLDLLFDELVKTRDQIAKNSGFSNYRDYAFSQKNRFDYSPEDCFAFHDTVERTFVPLSRSIDEERRAELGLDLLKPWDMMVDPKGRQPLAPFKDVDGLVAGCGKVLKQVDPVLSSYFIRMTQLGLLDLGSRKGKAPGGYQEDLSRLKLPFIFMNAAGKDADMRTLLHECGHSFHTFLMRDAGLPFYNSGQNIPAEFAEVASTTMELVGSEHLAGTVYDQAGANRSNRAEVINMAKLLPWVATIDAFQHWAYTNPGHSHEERAEAWTRTFRRFSGIENYDGYEERLRFRWQRQLHLFQFPFYYIEYGIATLGALGVWLRYRKDRSEAIEAYKAALSLGGSRPLPDLFKAAGLPWDMGRTTLGRYSEELGKLLKSS